MRICTNTPEETVKLGEQLGFLLTPGDVVCLKGELGAGKTCFAQGVARGLAVDDLVTSPTFTIINEYQGRYPFYHMDFYRLTDPLELEDLGYDEYFYGDGVTLIEWPERAAELLPESRLDICVSTDSDSAENPDLRKIHFRPYGAACTALLEELMARVRTGY